jgi:hypothetical protein
VLAAYAAMRIVVFQAPKGVERLARAAAEWLERARGPVHDLRAEFCLEGFVHGWIRSRRGVVARLRELEEKAQAVGDLQYATYSSRIGADYAALCGMPLRDLIAKLEAMHRRDRFQALSHYADRFARMYGLLHGKTSRRPDAWRDALSDDLEFTRSSQDSGVAAFRVCWVMVLCFLGRNAEALEQAQSMGSHGVDRVGACAIDFVLFRGLAAAACAIAEKQPRARRAQLRILRSGLKQLRKWAPHGPDLPHMVGFLEAELARVRGDSRRCLRLYADAIRRAQECEYVHHVALMQERRAEVFLAERRKVEAVGALREASVLYATWQAGTKVREIAARMQQLQASIRG